MDSIKRIGHPHAFHTRDGKDKSAKSAPSANEERKSPKVVAPALFAIPSKENYHPGSGFGVSIHEYS